MSDFINILSSRRKGAYTQVNKQGGGKQMVKMQSEKEGKGGRRKKLRHKV
jgi:hypothetical protein